MAGAREEDQGLLLRRPAEASAAGIQVLMQVGGPGRLPQALSHYLLWQPEVGCPGGLVEAPFCCDRESTASPSLDVLIQALSPKCPGPRGTLPWRPAGAGDTFLWFRDF